MKIDYSEVKLHFKSPVTVSRETHRSHTTILVRLNDGHAWGYGEATEFQVYSASKANILNALEKAQRIVHQHKFSTPQSLYDFLFPVIGHEPFAMCAIDVAAWDLWSIKQSKKIRELVGGSLNDAKTSITLGLTEPDKTIAYLEKYRSWQRIKVKLGGRWDEENLAVLLEYDHGKHCADVNGGWSLERARHLLRSVPSAGLQFIEQPIAVGHAGEIVTLRKEFPEHVFIADEEFRSDRDLERCAQAFSGVNIKLMKCGGITPCLDLLKKVRHLGLKASIGCMPESSVGATAVAHLAHLFDYSDFDSIEFIANDPAVGIQILDGRATFNDLPGLGIEVDGSVKWSPL